MVIWKERKVNKKKARQPNLFATKEDQAFTLLPTCKTRPTLHKGGKLQTYIQKRRVKFHVGQSHNAHVIGTPYIHETEKRNHVNTLLLLLPL